MKRLLLLSSLTLLVTPMLLSGLDRGTKIAFTVAPGTTLTKTYEMKEELTLDAFDMTVNGQAPPMVPEMDMSITGTTTMEIEDTYSKVADGRPTMLTRSFETLGGEAEVAMEVQAMGNTQNEDTAMEMSSVLEGESVEFVWSDEEEAYETVLPEGSALDEEDVEGLIEDMDFRSLLPDEEVDEGDEWEVDLTTLLGVFSPGGDLKLEPDEATKPAMGGGGDMGTPGDYFNEDLEGEFIAVFDGVRKVEDVEVAVIKFTFELSNAVDITDKSRDALDDAELPEGVGEIEIESVDIEMAYEGEGTLLWNLAAGHFQSFEATGDFEVLLDQAMLIEAMGQEMSMEQTLEFSGSLTFEVSAE